MTGTRILMDFEVTESSHTLDAYLEYGGYASAKKALAMQPGDVVMVP